MNPVTRIGAALFIASGILVCTSATGQLREPFPIPAGVSAQEQTNMERQRASLMAELNSLKVRIAAHNQKCGDVPSDSPLVDECRTAQGKLRSEVKQYQSHLADYESSSEKIMETLAQRQAAQEENIKGLNALSSGDYATAVKHLGKAHDYAPDDRNIQENLERARAALRQSRGETGKPLQER
jgi:Flp pilus assembly protein TadD